MFSTAICSAAALSKETFEEFYNICHAPSAVIYHEYIGCKLPRALQPRNISNKDTEDEQPIFQCNADSDTPQPIPTQTAAVSPKDLPFTRQLPPAICVDPPSKPTQTPPFTPRADIINMSSTVNILFKTAEMYRSIIALDPKTPLEESSQH